MEKDLYILVIINSLKLIFGVSLCINKMRLDFSVFDEGRDSMMIAVLNIRYPYICPSDPDIHNNAPCRSKYPTF